MPDCPDLRDWFHKQASAERSENGEPPDAEPETDYTMAEYYCWRRLMEARATEPLHRALETRDWSKGVEIMAAPMPPNDAPCEKGDIHVEWGDLTSLPKLPCGWGCQCSYSVWLESP